VSAVFDDTTPDSALRLELLDPKGTVRASAWSHRRAPDQGQSSRFDLTEYDECLPGNYEFPRDRSKRSYRLRAVDLAGNESEIVAVDVATRAQRLAKARPQDLERKELPPLYRLPGLGVVSKPTVYRAAGALLTLLMMAGVWVRWRLKR
jgi:hypothetical protein